MDDHFKYKPTGYCLIILNDTIKLQPSLSMTSGSRCWMNIKEKYVCWDYLYSPSKFSLNLIGSFAIFFILRNLKLGSQLQSNRGCTLPSCQHFYKYNQREILHEWKTNQGFRSNSKLYSFCYTNIFYRVKNTQGKKGNQ